MSKKHVLLVALLAALLVLASFSTAYAADRGLDEFPDPVDPQSWQMNRDRTWDNFIPNPVIDWKKEVNPDGYYNVRNSANRVSKIRGALCLFEYLDRPFITSQPVGSDVLGYYMYKPEGGGLDYDGGIIKNPIISQPRTLKESEYATDNTNFETFQKDPAFANWWKDFLIGEHPANNGSSQEEFYLENTYGKYHLQFDAYGPWEVNCFEFEIRDGYQGTTELPPSFRSPSTGAPTAANPGNLRSSGTIDTFAFALMSSKLGNSFIVNNYDFFHILHAGYDESGVWQEFGMGQYPSRKDLPDELTPIGRMHKVEEIFNARPELLAIYADRYRGTSAPGRDFWAAELAKYNAMVVLGIEDEYVFKLSQNDWDWANNWRDQTARNTRYVAWTSWEAGVGEWSHMSSTSTFGSSRNYSTQGECDAMATFAHEFGHISSIGDNYDNPYTYRSHPRTEPWELMSRGSFSGPFGDHGRWTCPGMEGGSVPTNFMAFNKSASSSYDTAAANPDYLTITNQQLAARTPLVAEIVARNIPLNNNKTTARPQGLYPWLETEFDIPLAAPHAYKAIRMNFGSGTWADVAPLKASGFSWYPARATVVWVEVVQRTGYDSFAPDDGVIIGRGGRVVDANVGDIGLIDYMVEDGITLSAAAGGGKVDDYFSYTLGHMAQLYDAAFHAGKSSTDTGYYKSVLEPGKFYQQTANGSGIYNVVATAPQSTADYGARYFASESSGMSWQQALIKPGSIVQWEPQDGRPVASGDTVNEWYDIPNKMHYYILAKNMHEGKYGDFLTYTVGLLHDDGVAVNGDLVVTAGKMEAADPGRVATQWFTVKNTGSATDIIRLSADCGLEATLLNDLYAIEAGQTIEVPVYILIPDGNFDLESIKFTASSESNATKSTTVTVPVFSANINAPAQIYIKDGNRIDYVVSVVNVANEGANLFTIEAGFDAANLNYLGYTFAPSVLTYSPSQGKFSYDVASGKLILDMFLGKPDTLLKADTETPLVTFHFAVKDGVPAGPDQTVVDGFLSNVKAYCFIAGKSSPVDAIVTKPGAPTKILVHPLGYEGGDLDEATISWLIYHHLYKTGAATDWDEIKRYDLNGNGMIDLADIVALWSLIGK
ncbi:MAG: hypothetical protein FWF85_08655 [Clostridiales bacterium]|nr:hypothetical protein [Clostridiales bacterium]